MRRSTSSERWASSPQKMLPGFGQKFFLPPGLEQGLAAKACGRVWGLVALLALENVLSTGFLEIARPRRFLPHGLHDF